MESNRGFTLMELMVTLVIVAILAAVAIPSYTQYIQRARRTEARVALENAMTTLQKFYLQNGRYPDDEEGTNLIGTTENGYYQTDYVSGTNPQVSAIAATGTSQANDTKCRMFAIFVSGTRIARDAADTDSTAECW